MSKTNTVCELLKGKLLKILNFIFNPKFLNILPRRQMKVQKLTGTNKSIDDTDSQITIDNKSSIDYNLPHSCDEICRRFKCCNDRYRIMDYNPMNYIYCPDEPIGNIVFNFSLFFLTSFEKAYNQKYNNEEKNHHPCDPATIDKDKIEKNSVLVLDLDQTLVCSEIYSKLFKEENVGLEVTNENFAKQQFDFYTIEKDKSKVTTRFRPCLEDFLNVASKYFDLAIYTAGMQAYADGVIDYLETKFKICHRLYGRHCHTNGPTIKYLDSFIEAYDNVYMVDNEVQTFSHHIEHGIYIENWYGDEKDIELKKLAELLPIIHRDGKEAVKKYMRTEEILMLWKESKRPPNKKVRDKIFSYERHIQRLLNDKKNDK